ncbi:MAG: TolC family protein [Bacteroidota bacterium]|nr:TolC family protein [Bacteroidota bacterium]
MKKIIHTVLFLSLAGAGFAQQANNELKTLINGSFTYFPRFQELEQGVQVAEQRAELAGLGNKPSVSAAGNYTYIAPVPKIPFPTGGGTKEVQFQPNHNINTGISILEPLYDFGRTRLAIERARLDVQQAKNNVEYNRAQLAAQVANVFYTVIYLQKAITIQDSVIAVLGVNKKLLEDKFKNGDALKLDVLTMQNNIDIEQNRKADLQNQLQKQYTLLQFATGQAVTPTTSRFDFTAGIADTATALQAAQTNNYEFLIAQQRIRQAEADVAISQLANKPSVNLNGTTGFRNGFQPEIGQVRFNYALGVGISVPLFNGGRDKKQTQIAQSLVKQNQLAVESLNNQYNRDIKQALTDVQTNQERLRTAAEQVSIAKEALRVAQSRYKNGISTNVELLNANTNLQKVELAQVQYQYQLTLAQIELARLTGAKYW